MGYDRSFVAVWHLQKPGRGCLWRVRIVCPPRCHVLIQFLLLDRYAKMLDDIALQTVGTLDDIIITGSYNPFSSDVPGCPGVLTGQSGTQQQQANGNFTVQANGAGPIPYVF